MVLTRIIVPMRVPMVPPAARPQPAVCPLGHCEPMGPMVPMTPIGPMERLYWPHRPMEQLVRPNWPMGPTVSDLYSDFVYKFTLPKWCLALQGVVDHVVPLETSLDQTRAKVLGDCIDSAQKNGLNYPDMGFIWKSPCPRQCPYI